jgi:hypothetical protein
MKTSKITFLFATVLVSLMISAFALNLAYSPWGWTSLWVYWNPSSYSTDDPLPEPWTASLSYWGPGSGSTWKTPTAVYSKCGQDSYYPATRAIDGSTSTYWRHSTTEYHWIVLDMGQSIPITKIRIYQSSYSTYRWGRSSGLSVYVSNDPNNWGSYVWTGKLDSSGWRETGTFSATGRYVKLVSKSTSSSQRLYEVQMRKPGGINPSTILLEGLYAPESPPYYGWWGSMLIVPFDGYDVLEALWFKGGGYHMSPGQHCINLEITANLYDGTAVSGTGAITLTIPEIPP